MPHLAGIGAEIGWLVLEIQAVEGFAKQQKTKDIRPSLWLYLKINICECRLISLDHIASHGQIFKQDLWACGGQETCETNIHLIQLLLVGVDIYN